MRSEIFTQGMIRLIIIVLVTANGLISYAQTPSCTTQSGGTWTNPGTLVVDIHGINTTCAAIDGFDQIDLTAGATATLSGTLDVDLGNSFTPSPGQTFTILSGGTITGTFATLSLPTATTYSWAIQYNATTVVLQALAPCTINGLQSNYCMNDNVDIINLNPNIGGATYNWSFSGTAGFIANSPSPGAASIAPSNLTSGNYNVSVSCTSASGACAAAASFNVNPIPNATPVSMTQCEGTTGSGISVFDLTSLNSTVTSSPGVTITYHLNESAANNGTGAIVTPSTHSSSSVIRYARIEFGTGCYNVAAVTLTVVADPSATASGATTVCSGINSTTLTTTPAAGTGTCMIQWQRYNTATLMWDNVGTNSNTYIASNLLVTSKYRATYACTGTLCTEGISNEVTVTVDNCPVLNTNTTESFFTIQAAINDAQTLNGHTLTVQPGTYNEQVIVNKELTIKSATATKAVINFTGTVTGKPTLFDVTANNVTVENLQFDVDLSKLRSAVIASSAGLDAITVKDNMIGAYGTPAGSYGDRNAVSVNYSGSTNYRVAAGGVNSVSFTGNTVTGTAPDSYFRSGISLDEGGLTATGNTLTTINHDVLLRFASNGANNISNNNFNGGGLELADQNAGSGTITVSNNTFTGAGAPSTAKLRVKNGEFNVAHVISTNSFNTFDWGVSLENMRNVTLNGNTFTGDAATDRHIVVNTKSISSNSNTISQFPVDAVMTNNSFAGQGIALTFQNHDSDNDSYGTFTIGSAGNANTFAAGLSTFIQLDAQTGTSTGSTFPTYPGTGSWPTTMDCWSTNLNVQNNTFDVGAGQQAPQAMSASGRTTLEGKLNHKPDVACLGTLQYFLPVKNVTQNTFYSTIQSAINAAAINNVIELAEWTFNEAVTIDKSLTLQGVNPDKSKQVINGTGLGVISGITINNGVTGVTIQNLTVQNFTGTNGNSHAGIYGIGGNNNLTVTNVAMLNNPTASGFYANGPVDNVTITNSMAVNNGGNARGIVIWNGLKTNITITGNMVTNNSCCGIELSDGNASGVNISGNTIDIGGGDNAIGVVGLNNSVGANTINNNIITGGGRFGIEIKNPASGVTVNANTVTMSVQNGDVRDRAGIAILRRSITSGNVDVPNGVTITGNTVTGYQQSSTSEGFGIVVEGTNHTVTGNTVSGCEVGILQQQNPSGYPGDADQSDLADQYFGRGNSPMTCGNTISGNTLSSNGTDTRNIGVGAGIVTNTNTSEIFCSIQAAINDAQTLNGHTLTVQPGTYNEQVIVNKELTIKSATATKAVINFTGTVTGKPTLFDVTANNVTVENLQFDVDLSKLRSAVIASSAGLDAITVKDNMIGAYGTPAGSYGDRNAVSVNYSGSTNYRVAAGGVNSVSFTGNTVTGTAPDSYFRSGISLDEGGLTATGNTLTTINHDVLLRFASNGANNISNNNFNGGGLELADQNAGSGTITVSNNTFTGAGAPGTAKLRVKNGEFNVAHVISTNSFNTFDWGVSLENMRNVTLNGNTFTGDAATDRHIVINTKSISSNSNTISQFPVDAVMTNNSFAGQGIALTFQNHDSDNDSYGTFTIGNAGNANTFAAGLSTFIQLDAQTGTSTGSTFPTYPGTGSWPTTMDCWSTNLNVQNNTFDVGAGQQAPQAMSASGRTTLEGKLNHKPDVACLGTLQYFLPVKNVTQNTFYSTIQSAINAAAINNVIELAEWTFNEAVTIDKSLTLQGVNPDKSKQVINGTGLGVISGITINNGVTGVTIQNLTVQNFTGTNGNSHAGIYGIGGNNNLTVTNVAMLNNPTASGFYANGPVDNVTITNSMAVNNGGNARGIVIWNGLKTNITITGNMVTNNSCCGIELSDGNASGVNISGNTIDIGGGDNAIGVVGLNNSVGANTINNNIITGGGRFGIEIKNPASGVTVNANTVTMSVQNGDVRDRAGIAILRRSITSGNVDVPNGVTITGNTVTGYQQSSTSEGFGIVVEGTNHTVTGNTVSGCEVGILQQQNPSEYPGDADQSDLADQYFGRGNSPMTCGNTISGNTLSSNGTDTRNIGVGAGIVTNTNTSEIFCSIQAAINDAQTLNGHTLTVQPGTYNEQVIVNKELTIKSATATKAVINFTGTVTGKPTLFDVTANNVTVENLQFDVDLSKLRSAVIASSAGLDAITVKDNMIGAYGTPAGSYGDRNAVSVNYSGSTNYRVAAGGVNSVSFTGNTVTGTAPDSYFRSGISLDEGGLTATGNTLTTINHDVLLRFASNGANNISNNNFNGGGLELADQNAGSGTITVSNNTFTGAGAPGTAKLRVKNGEFNVAHVISTNSFNTFDWGVSLENMRNVTLNGNTFTGDAATDRHIVINTKSISSNSNTISQFPVDAVMTNNSFAGQGIALTFQNHDSDNDSYGTFTIGNAGNANTFAAGLSTFIQLDAQTGTSTGSTFPTYPGTGSWPTTMDCWSTNLNVQNNTFDVGAGQQAPQAMSASGRTTLEGKLNHKPDVACLGTLQYFLPVKNVTQNTFYSTIQSAINAAAINNVIELAEWTFNEAVTIDKSLTLQGVNPDKSKQVINGTGLGVISGITINNGVTGVTIQNLTVQNFTGTNGNSHAGIYGIGGNNNLTVTNVAMLNNPTASGFYANGPVDNVTITNSMAVNNGGNARGIVIWNGLKTNITITGNMVTNNSCCGIELSDGNASGVNISGNTIDIGGGDNAIGVVGLNNSVGANTINNNIITGGGRFGIEIKNPASGVTVNANTVTMSVQNGDVRDRAGIAILRRSITSGNVDVPNGVTITGNTVTGYQQSSTSEGFGIVVEGTNHTVTGNTVSGCEVGILQQQNPSGYPGDADQSDLADQYFGRGNSPMTCGNTISGNTLSSNGTDTRNIGVGAGIVTNTNTSEIFCSIQSAINDAQTLDGHTLNVSAGTFNENVTLTKDLTINGAGPATTILTPTVACSGNGITIFANNATVQNLKVINFSNGLAVSSTGVLISNVESVSNCTTGLELSNGTTNLSIQNSKLNNNSSSGFRKGTAAIVNGFTLNNSEVKGNIFGCFVAKNDGVGGTFDNVIITNSDFSNNTQKGMYFEALSNAMIDGVTMDASGIDPAYNNNAGIDINLKYGVYTNITIQNSDIINSGVYGTATDVEQTAAVMIKARNDASSYNSNPASLSNVLVKNNRISGPQNGIRFGEFGKINAGPSNVTLEGNDLSHAFANKAVIRRTNNSINLNCNWHGSTDIVTIWSKFSQTGSGSINLNSVLAVGSDPNPSVGFQPSGSCTCPSGNVVNNTTTLETFCTIQAAIDDAQTAGGHTLTVGPGTYVENIVVNKELDIRGANHNVNPNTGVRGPESILMTAIIEVGGTNNSRIVAIDASNVTIKGFLLDGNNPALTSGFVNNVGADVDIRNGIDNAKGIQNLRVENNIIKNMVYYGVRIQSTTGLSPAVSSGHEIHNNRFIDMGTYQTVPSGWGLFGGGVLLQNSHYAKITNNVMLNVRIGVQLGNFQDANPIGTFVHTIDNNQIQARRIGIFYNLLRYSPWTVANNSITGYSSTDEGTIGGSWRGLRITSVGLAGMGNSLFNNNSINGSAISNINKEGINVWNVTDNSRPIFNGGTITGVNTGAMLMNHDATFGNGTDGAHATLNNVNITATGIGVHLLDSPSSTTHANVQATLANNFITGGVDGVKLEEAVSGKVTGTANINSITGQSGFAINATTITNPVAATCNWYGVNDPATVATKISGAVNYTPYLLDGIDASVNPGFQHAGCGTPVVISSATPTHILCGPTTGSIAVAFTGGDANFSIAWSGSSSGSASNISSGHIITPLAAGTYTVTVTSMNGTTSTATATIQYLPVSNVTDNLHYPTIQAAIDAGATSTGDLINVCSGNYDELVTVNKSVTISGFGSGNTLIQKLSPALNSNFVTIAASNVTIKDIAIVGPTGVSSSRGIFIDGTRSGILIKDVISNQHNYGVHVNATADITGLTLDNTELNVNGNGLQIDAGAKVNGLTINGGKMNGNLFGLSVAAHDAADNSNDLINVNITGTEFANNSVFGLLFNKGQSMNLTGLTVTGNGDASTFGVGAGIYFTWRQGTYNNISLTNSVITGNRTAGSYIGSGIWVRPRAMASVSGLTITNNNISGNGSAANGLTAGILVLKNDNNTGTDPGVVINGNSITGNANFGISSTTSNNLIATCNWWGTPVGNTILGFVSGNVNTTSWLVPDIAGATYSWSGLDKYSCNGTPVVIASASSTPNQFCQNNGTITVNFSGGATPYTVSWTGTSIGGPVACTSGNAFGSFTNGTYTITVKDNNGSMASTSVQVGNLPIKNSSNTTYYATIQAAIDAASPGQTIELCNNHTEGLVTINKPLVLDGNGKTLTSTSPTWGIGLEAQNINLHDIVLTGTGTQGIQQGCDAHNLAMTNVTVNNCGGTGISIYGSDNCVLTNITSTNNKGNGLNITNCNNTTINGITTSGNAFSPGGFSAGIGIFTSSTFCLPAGINGLALNGTVSIAEPTKVYSQKADAGHTITGLTGPDLLWAVGIGATDRNYWPSKATSYAVVDALFEPLYSLPNTSIYVVHVPTEIFYVEDNPNGDNTPPMLIQTAVNLQTAGGTIMVESGTYTENVTVNKSLTIKGANYNVVCDSRGTESVINGGAGTAITVASNGVTINGFQLDGNIGVANAGYEASNISFNKVNAVATGLDISGQALTVTDGLTIQNNCITNTTALAGTGIALNGISGTASATISDNTLSNGDYGYSVVDFSTTPVSTISGGTVNNYKHGTFISNQTGASTFKPSTINLSGMVITGLPASSQTGIWVHSGGSNAADVVTSTIDNVTISGTGRGSSDWAGIRFADFSTGAGTRQAITITASTISNNLNRGIHVRGPNANVEVATSTISNNGADPAGGQSGYGIYSGTGANVNIHNNFITNPASSVSSSVAAIGTANGGDPNTRPGGNITANNNSILANGNTGSKLAFNANVGPNLGGLIANCNWWGSACSQNFKVSPLYIVGDVVLNTWLIGNGDGAGTGFQPTDACRNNDATITGPAMVCLGSTGNVYTSEAGRGTYTWLVDGGLITAGGGTGDNTVTVDWIYTAGAKTVTVTHTNNGCETPLYVFNVTVKPLPVVSDQTAMTCSDLPLAHNLDALISGAGDTYTYTVASSDQTNVPAGPARNTASAANITDTYTNTTSSDVMITYTVTPIGANGCAGNTFNVVVTVKPEPVVAGQTAMTCSDVPLAYSLDALISGAGDTYTYTVASSDQANVPAGPARNTASAANITDTYTNTTSSDVTITYTVTPIGANGCSGNTFNVVVTVKPEPVVGGQTAMICSDVALAYNLAALISGAGDTYTYTVASSDQANVPAGPTRNTASADNITDNYTNTTSSDVMITYTVTPIGANGCSGNTFNVVVTVKPEPVVAGQTAMTCSDVPLAYSLDALISGTGDTFTYTVASSDQTNVPASPARNTASAANITDTYTNTTSSDVTITYTVTPIGANGCSGNTFNIVVTVKPEPNPTPTTTIQACSGSPYSFDFDTYIQNNGIALGQVTYVYNVVKVPNVAVLDPDPAGLGFTSSNGAITNTITNFGSGPITVRYTVTPTGANGCVGSSFVVDVVINPAPTVNIFPNGSNNLCAGDSRVISGGANPSGTYNYSWTIQSQTTTPAATFGSPGTIATSLMIPALSTSGTVTVRFTATNSLLGCAAFTDFVFNVDLKPIVTLAATTITSCENPVSSSNSIFNLPSAVSSTTGLSTTYHTSQSDAQNGIGAINNVTTYVGTDQQTIWVRTATGACFDVKSFTLDVINCAPAVADLQITYFSPQNTVFLNGQTKNIIIQLNEVGGANTTGTIQFWLAPVSGYSYNLDQNLTQVPIIIPPFTTSVNNSDWIGVPYFGGLLLTSNTVIPANMQRKISVSVTAIGNLNQNNINAIIFPGSGGDNNSNNNSIFSPISTNN